MVIVAKKSNMNRNLTRLLVFFFVLVLTGCNSLSDIIGINNQCYTCVTTATGSFTPLLTKEVCGGPKKMEKHRSENQGNVGTVMYFTTCKENR